MSCHIQITQDFRRKISAWASKVCAVLLKSCNMASSQRSSSLHQENKGRKKEKRYKYRNHNNWSFRTTESQKKIYSTHLPQKYSAKMKYWREQGLQLTRGSLDRSHSFFMRECSGNVTQDCRLNVFVAHLNEIKKIYPIWKVILHSVSLYSINRSYLGKMRFWRREDVEFTLGGRKWWYLPMREWSDDATQDGKMEDFCCISETHKIIYPMW